MRLTGAHHMRTSTAVSEELRPEGFRSVGNKWLDSGRQIV
jgi:hypothetical protein